MPYTGLYFCAFGPWQLLYCSAVIVPPYVTQSVKALRCTILVVSRTLTHTWTGAVSDINAVIFL